MSQVCDHTSVGTIVENEWGELLLIERAKFPFGLAAPAGHVDSHSGPLEAARQELLEEVGIKVKISDLLPVITNRYIANHCRRQQGDYHVWNVYHVRVKNPRIQRSLDETNAAGWYNKEQLQVITATSAQASKVPLEPIWRTFFEELGYV